MDPSDPLKDQPSESVPDVPKAAVSPQTRLIPVQWLIAIGLASALLTAIGFMAWLGPRSATDQSDRQEVPLIRYGVVEGPLNSFYPASKNIIVSLDVNRQIFEGLVAYEGGTRIVPLLATRWTNPDDSTWLFTLKPNVKFHTGKMMTAADVKASLEAARDTDQGKLFATSIKEVSVVDDNTIRIITDGPDPILLNKLTFLSIFDSTSGRENDPINGTGPYVVKPGTVPTAEHLQLLAYDDYHGGRPLTRELDIAVYPDTTAQTKAFAEGKLDIAGPLKDANFQELASLQPEKFGFTSLEVAFLLPNHQKTGPLQKSKVRQAVYLAIDIPALLKARGFAAEAASQIVPQDIPGYDPAITRPARDVARAKQLLTEAGYPRGLSLTLTYVQAGDDAAQELARQLKEAGITLKLDKLSEADYDDKVFSAKAELALLAYSTDVLDAVDVFTAVFQQLGYYANPELDRLVAEANQTLDQPKRLATLQQASKLLMDDVAWVPLYTPTRTYAFAKPYVATKDVAGNVLGINFWRVYVK